MSATPDHALRFAPRSEFQSDDVVRTAAQCGSDFRAVCVAVSEARGLRYDDAVRLVRDLWPTFSDQPTQPTTPNQ